MKRHFQIAALLAAPFLIGACSYTPSFNGPLGNPKTPPNVADLVTHIECEIWRIQMSDPDKYAALKTNKYVAAALLTVEVTNTQGLTPSLSFIDPYKVPMGLTGASGTNGALTIGGQVTGTQHRLMSQTFAIDLDSDWITGHPRPDPDHPDKTIDRGKYDCRNDSGTGPGLKGDLGLEAIILAGLGKVGQRDFLYHYPNDADDSDDATTLGTIKANNVPVFGTTVDFTVIYGLSNLGPTWTLAHFKGPGGGSSGLLNATRTSKDTLTISFAAAAVPAETNVVNITTVPAAPPPPPPPAAAVAPALPPALPPGATASDKFNAQMLNSLQQVAKSIQNSANQISQSASSSAPPAAPQITVTPNAANLARSKEAAARAAQQNNQLLFLRNLLPG